VALVETLKRAVGIAASVLFGRMLFDEAVTAPKLLAIALIAAGTVLLTWPAGGWPG
jgi:multidrug transporter EmrE-like cation transporter